MLYSDAVLDVIDKPAATAIKGDGGIDIVNICAHQIGDNGPFTAAQEDKCLVLPIFSNGIEHNLDICYPLRRIVLFKVLSRAILACWIGTVF